MRYAASAKFDSENKVWRLSQVDESDLTDPKQVTGSQMVSGTWKTNLTPDKLGVVALDPDALSISGLHNYVKYLKSSGQGFGTLPAQYVEQNLPAAVGGGDDADGAVVYLWPAA